MLELAVASALGALLTLAATSFAVHQTRELGVTRESLQLSQSSRTGLARLKADLRVAGSGVGYTAAGRFAGIEVGDFSRGTAEFQSNNQIIQLGTTNTVTDDVGIIHANGDFATIAAYSPSGTAEFCAGTAIDSGDQVLLRSADGISAKTVLITGVDSGPCSYGQCIDGCDLIQFDEDDTYVTDATAVGVNYTGGEVAGDFTQVTYFVESTDSTQPDLGRLRRAEGTCLRRDHTCGEVILDNVESLQFRIYERGAGGWTDRTADNGRIASSGRLRVDIELAVRALNAKSETRKPSVDLVLEPDLCFPTCGTRDAYARRLVRTSIEIKNSGRVSYRSAL